MSIERILINLRGYCLYCLKKLSNDGDNAYYQSPACTPVAPSPLSTPLRTRCHNVHNLPPEERLAPFTDLCRYMGVDLPDCYAFGDGSEPEVMYPPLCEKCHDLSARLCILQDELQYIQTRIHNTVERIHRRVASTCDTRGALKREEFHKDFRRKSKGSLSRGRGENSEMKKVNDLLKAFQIQIVQKDHENRERRKRRATNILFPDCRNSIAPSPFVSSEDVNIVDLKNEENGENNQSKDVNIVDLKNEENGENNQSKDVNIVDLENEENEENIQPETEHDQTFLTGRDYLPPEETLRCSRPQINENTQQFEVENVQAQRETYNTDKPYPDVSTIMCSYQSDESRPRQEDNNDDDIHMKTTVIVGVTTRLRAQARARGQENTIDRDRDQGLQNSMNDSFAIRRRTRRVAK